MKKGYKELCDRKKKEENERMERRAREVIKKNEVWELINKERKIGKNMNGGIEIEERRNYFKGLLGRVENIVIRKERKRGVTKEKEEDLGWDEQ